MNLLELTTGGTQYQISAETGTGVYPVGLKLPEELTCSQCVLQWKWKTGLFHILCLKFLICHNLKLFNVLYIRMICASQPNFDTNVKA